MPAYVQAVDGSLSLVCVSTDTTANQVAAVHYSSYYQKCIRRKVMRFQQKFAMNFTKVKAGPQ